MNISKALDNSVDNRNNAAKAITEVNPLDWVGR